MYHDVDAYEGSLACSLPLSINKSKFKKHNHPANNNNKDRGRRGGERRGAERSGEEQREGKGKGKGTGETSRDIPRIQNNSICREQASQCDECYLDPLVEIFLWIGTHKSFKYLKCWYRMI